MQTQTAEPREGMFTVQWREARARIESAEIQRHTLFSVMVRLIEGGAECYARLQMVFEQREGSSRRDRRLDHLLQFIDEDLTDVFRDLTSAAANLIPGPDWLETADPPEAQAQVRLLVRYLAVSAAAAEHPEIPLEVRRVFAEVAAQMEGWGDELYQVMQAIADSELSPPPNEE